MLNSYTALDLETTGLNPKYDKIIEVGAVRVRQGKITDRFQRFIDPGMALPPAITELTGITQEELQGAEHPEQVIPELIAFLGEDVILGHSVMFDYSFLKKEAVNQGIWRMEQNHQGLDTLRLARIFLPELESRRLTDLCQYFQIAHHAHRALGDAESTAQLYEILVRKFGETCDAGMGSCGEDIDRLMQERNRIFQPFPLVYKIKKESPIRPMQKEKLYSLHKQHKIVPDYDVERLTRNEASRMIDRIYAVYGRTAQDA